MSPEVPSIGDPARIDFGIGAQSPNGYALNTGLRA